MGLEAALAWKTILRSLEAFLFQMNKDNGGNSIDLILVRKCRLSLSDYRKEEIMVSAKEVTQFVVYTSQ